MAMIVMVWLCCVVMTIMPVVVHPICISPEAAAAVCGHAINRNLS